MLKKFVDRKLLKYLILFYTLLVIISMVKKAYWKYQGSYSEISWYELFAYNIFLDWVVVIIFMIFISYLTKKMFEKWNDWKKIIAVHLFFSFFIGYFIFFITAIIIFIIGDYTFDQAIRNISFDHFMSVVELNFLVYFSMIGIINVYYYIKKVKNIELQKSQLQTHLANTKLNALKAQLHPHFMFNTLNSISSLIEIDKEKSQNLIADFGDLFRGILEYKDENQIPIKEEISLLNKYLDIISVRFSDHLVIEKNIDSGLENILVPNLMLQPLVENAVKHGYSYNKTELRIDIEILKKSKYLHITIENNGDLLESNFKELLEKGVGLKNTQDRLGTLFESNFEFIVRNKKDKTGVETFIKIPIIESFK